MKTYRIVRRYHPCIGTWYVIQKRGLFRWVDLPLAMKTVRDANGVFIDLMNEEFDSLHPSFCETPLVLKDGKYVEEYPCKTYNKFINL